MAGCWCMVSLNLIANHIALAGGEHARDAAVIAVMAVGDNQAAAQRSGGLREFDQRQHKVLTGIEAHWESSCISCLS